VQQFPEVPGNTATAAVFAHVSPEATAPIVSDAALEVEAQIRRLQAAARQDPVLNGQDATRRLRRS
jgi:ABC-type uncharacterized transport system YnjBCD substrate-binding protein